MFTLNKSNQLYTLGFTSQVSSTPELYRQTINLTFTLAGMADEIAITQAAIHGEFKSLDLQPSNPQLTGLSNATLVTLNAPRRILRIETGTAGEDLELYRVDVNAIAKDPTVTADSHHNINLDFTDSRFAIYRAGRSALSPAEISQLWVQSMPSGPRLGLAPAGKLDQALYFWQGVDQIDAVDFADTLEQFLNRQLTDLAEQGADRPEQLEIHLLIESFAPCRVQLDSLLITYRLVTQSWLDSLPQRDEEKRVLRFADDCLDCRSESVLLPKSATVAAAQLRVIESWGASGGVLPSQDGSGVSPQAPGSAPSQKSGMKVGVEGWVAQEFQPDEAISVVSLALGLLPLSSGAELCVTLREAAGGRPTGSTLLEEVVALGPAGQSAWVMVWLPQPAVLNKQLYWLMLKAAEGQAVWLAESGVAASAGQIWQQFGSEQNWGPVAELAEKEMLVQFFSKGSGEASTIGTPMGGGGSASQLWVGEQSLTGLVQEADGVLVYELAPALNLYLAAQAGGMVLLEDESESPSAVESASIDEHLPTEQIQAIELISIPLVFDGVGLKQLSLFPPRIEFSF